MFAKMVLPKLGGAPAVWSVAMVFFQTALLGGYAYAYVLNRGFHRAAVLCLVGQRAAAAKLVRSERTQAGK